MRNLGLAVVLLLITGSVSTALELHPDVYLEAGSDAALRKYEEGYRSYHEGDYGKAEQKLHESLVLEPNLIKAHYWLGKLYREMGRLKESTFHHEEVLRLKKLIATRREALKFANNEYPSQGQILITREREKRAREAFDRCRRFLDEGQWDAALSEAKKAVDEFPGKLEYLLMLARIHWDRGEKKNSAALYVQLCENGKVDKPIFDEALERLLIEGETLAVRRMLRLWVRRFPTDDEARKTLEQIEMQLQGEPDAEVPAVGRVVRRMDRQVILDFGLDRRLRLADEYALSLRAFQPGETIRDTKGNRFLGREPDRVSGKLLVTRVLARSCWALIQQEYGA
ncbi:MAG TPA: hypothetical protein PKO06_09135, partial [Candidatus Ozemobacteraceae bacterium]|nr:hypothetical protein [Candidatus Ozemobacteraceae bacterium]